MSTPKQMLNLVLASTAVAMLCACTTTGMGGGELSVKGQDNGPVQFTWKSEDGGISGTLTATLPDAIYQGRFFQITQQTQRQRIAPLWDGWSEGWNDWPYWGEFGRYGPYDATQFITRYTGKVVASLRSDSGKRMRCRFHLADPIRGMAGGGEGECQLAEGTTISAWF